MDAKERLARISHHFLSDAGETSPQPPLYVLPVISPSKDQALLYALAQALRARGRSCAIVHGEDGGSHHTRPSLAEAGKVDRPRANGAVGLRALLGAMNGGMPLPEFCLVPLTSLDKPWSSQCDRALLSVPASLDGIRAAYIALKAGWSQGGDLALGVTMTQCPDGVVAQQHFDKLAQGVSRFLSVSLLNYGYMPSPPGAFDPINPIQSFRQQETGATGGSITDVILGDCTKADRVTTPW